MRITTAKNKSKKKQLEFRDSIDLEKCGTQKHKGKDIPYEHILHDDDAAEGANFYCYSKEGNTKEWEDLKLWAADEGNTINFLGNGLKNMLRSEHIAYNIFFPLEKLRRNNDSRLIELIELWLNKTTSIKTIDNIKIEYAPLKELKDNTSFDAYIEYTTKAGKNGAIGIEVKYTESSYKYGDTERDAMFDKSGESKYLTPTKECGFYVEDANLRLRDKKLKQPWRNHLLGIVLLSGKNKKYDEFYSLHLYPSINTYQEDVCNKYSDELNQDYKKYFIPLTFEKMISDCDKVNIDDEWVKYFRNRY